MAKEVEEMKKQLYRYYCPMRPPMLGAIPKSGLVSVHCFDMREFTEAAGREVWGWAEYNRELSENDVYNYELIKGF